MAGSGRCRTITSWELRRRRWKRRCATSRSISALQRFASTPSRLGRSAPSPAPALPTRQMFAFQQRHSPLRRGVSLEEIGGAALYLLSDLSTGVTGDVHFVDSGYNVVAMPHPTSLKDETLANEQAIDAAQ